MKMKKSCVELPRMQYLYTILIFVLLSSVRFVLSELVINEVSLENESDPKFGYVELINEGDPVVAEDYLLAFYNGESNLSLSISKLNNVTLDDDSFYVVVLDGINLALPSTSAHMLTDLPKLGKSTIVAIALFKINSNKTFSGSEVSFDVENATQVNALVFTTTWTANFSESYLAKEFGFDTKQIIFGNVSQSLSFCVNGPLSWFKNSSKTAGLANSCEASQDSDPKVNKKGKTANNTSISTTVTTLAAITPSTTANQSATTANPVVSSSPISATATMLSVSTSSPSSLSSSASSSSPSTLSSSASSSTAGSSATTGPSLLTTASSSTPLTIPTTVPAATPSTTPTTVPVPATSEKPAAFQKVVISEVYVNPPTTGDIGEYVELQDLSGKENVSLDGLSLVFWNGANLKKYSIIPLDGYRTGANGYFVISNDNDTTTHIYHNKTHFIQNGPMDGIVLYKDLNATAVKSTNIPTDNILDAVVYTQHVTHNASDLLLTKLFPKQTMAIPFYSFSKHTILARCYSNASKDLSAFTAVNSTTKAALNLCTPPKGLQINELKLSSGKFIELTSGERAFFPLEQMVLKVFNALTNQTTGSLRLSGRTNTNLSLLAEKPLNSTLLPVDDNNITTLLNSLGNTIPGAVALYWIPDLNSDLNIAITTEGLLDIVIYGTNNTNANSEFVTAFNKKQFNLPNDLGNKSVNYCPHDVTDDQVYVIAVASPNSENQCPVPPTTSSQSPSVSPSADPSTTTPTTTQPPVQFQINEVYFGDLHNFVEIKGPSNGAFGNLLVVFLKAGSPITLSNSVNLANKSLSADGLYVVEALLLQSEEEDSAVVLYELPSADYAVTTFDKLSQEATLLDFVVYSTKKTTETSDLMKGLAGQNTDQVAIWADTQSTFSITRCGAPRKEIWSFLLMKASKNENNTCLVPEVLINEINADNPSYDDQEFLELYDFGIGNVSLNPFVLVSFNGNTGGKKKAHVVNLWNEKTDNNGFFLVAVEGQNLSTIAHKNVLKTDNFFQNGPDAITLYKATPTTFKEESQPTKKHLLDVVIYGKDASDSLIVSLINALTPGGSSVTTSQTDKNVDLSMSRCVCWGKSKDSKAFTLSTPTPAKLNICPQNFTSQLPPIVDIFINELNSNSNGTLSEFLELKGPNDMKLDNLGLVFYNLPRKININLDNSTLDKDGFFIIGVDKTADKTVRQQVFLKNGLGAIALYDRRQWACVPENQMTVSRPGLLDAIVYTSSPITPSPAYAEDYLKALTLDNHTVEDSTAFKQDESINRCFDDRKLTSSRFAISLPTPKKQNECPSEKYALKISFKLIEADCKEFTKSESLKMEVATYVVTQVNSICHCGFTFANLVDYKFVCGSVILDATVHTSNQEQLELIQTSYKKFIKQSDKVDFANKTYTVDKSCLSNCRSVKPVTKKPEDHTTTIAVVVTCVVILAVIFVIVFVYYKRKRKGIAHFRMARFDAEDENLTVGDMDDFVGGGEQASFNNPLYFKS